jgi:hypothetical protein
MTRYASKSNLLDIPTGEKAFAQIFWSVSIEQMWSVLSDFCMFNENSKEECSNCQTVRHARERGGRVTVG